jgi:hypothetical protein
MLKLGTESGSLDNHIFNHLHLYSSADSSFTPEIGMGATILCWSDRRACTIIKVTPKTITVQMDTATRVDSNGISESQDYVFQSNPKGHVEVFRMTKRGWRSKNGNSLSIGNRYQYYDYSF